MNLTDLNQADRSAARELLTQCCSSSRWVDETLAAAPFADGDALKAAADKAWAATGEADWLEAFAGHPRIGDIRSLREKYANTRAMAAGEQSGMDEASDGVIAALAQGNEDYEARFGFIFIVCATGKSASEMLQLLQDRLSNEREEELRIAAAEQHKITHIRLEKLL